MADALTGDSGTLPAAVGATAAVTGLRRGSLSMVEVLSQSIANMAPTAAMAVNPLLVFLNAGNGTWLSTAIAVVLMLCVGYCAAQFARRMNSAGSFYVWVARALGPGAGHAAGWGLQLGYITTGMATIVGFGIFAGDFLSRLGLPGSSPAVLAVLFAIDFVVPVAVAIADMKLSARTSLVLESASVGLIILLCIAIWVVRGSAVDTNQVAVRGVLPGGIVVGVVLAIFSFVGFESAGSLGSEARNAQRSVGSSILLSALLVGLFYVVVSYSEVFGFRGSSLSFAKSQAPLPDLAGIVHLGFLAPLFDIGIAASAFACTLACTNAAARMAYAMAHDGMGVEPLKRVHEHRHTPHVAILAVAVPMLVVPVVLVVRGAHPVDVLGWTGTLATFGFMLAYALVSLAAPLYLLRIGKLTALVVPIAAVGVVSMLIVFYASWLPQTVPGGLFPAITWPYNLLPYLFFAWMAIGLAWYLLVRVRTPEVAAAIGTRFETHVH
jgi:amino acid transporter